MEVLNYALTGGNKTLKQIKSAEKVLLFQAWYTGLVVETASIEVWVSLAKGETFAKVKDATKTLVSTEGTAYFSLSGVSGYIVEFRLVVPGGTAGVLTKIEYQNYNAY